MLTSFEVHLGSSIAHQKSFRSISYPTHGTCTRLVFEMLSFRCSLASARRGVRNLHSRLRTTAHEFKPAEPKPATVTINGVAHESSTQETVLDACRKANVYVPTLCDHPDLSPAGLCRLCLVEVSEVRAFLIAIFVFKLLS